jgi:hypothetical protein
LRRQARRHVLEKGSGTVRKKAKQLLGKKLRCLFMLTTSLLASEVPNTLQLSIKIVVIIQVVIKRVARFKIQTFICRLDSSSVNYA